MSARSYFGLPDDWRPPAEFRKSYGFHEITEPQGRASFRHHSKPGLPIKKKNLALTNMNTLARHFGSLQRICARVEQKHIGGSSQGQKKGIVRPRVFDTDGRRAQINFARLRPFGVPINFRSETAAHPHQASKVRAHVRSRSRSAWQRTFVIRKNPDLAPLGQDCHFL